jgi:hypothetical protein
MVRAHRWIAVAGLLMLGACGASELPPSTGDSDFKSQINLAPLLPANADVVGVTVSPEGKRYVLDGTGRLYLLEPSRATLVYATTTPIELTDVVALGSERFAVTAENDGFMMDVHNQTLSSYFCYVPNISTGPVVGPPSVSQTLRSEGVAVKERTESVAFNPQTLQLFAQPQTTRLDTGAVVGSELFVFADSGGQPIQVWSMNDVGFLAGGMLAVDGARLLLGSRNRIYEMDGQNASPSLRTQLEDATIDISGLALDTDGDLLVLDRAGRRLLEMAMD